MVDVDTGRRLEAAHVVADDAVLDKAPALLQAETAAAPTSRVERFCIGIVAVVVGEQRIAERPAANKDAAARVAGRVVRNDT